MLRGHLDIVNLHEVAGWAQDDAQPNTPLSLIVTVNGELAGRVLANRHRADLEEAGVGTGRHSFEFQFPASLSPFDKHVIRICRETDGDDLPQSPVTLHPNTVFDASAMQGVAEFLQRSGTDHDIESKIDFLVGQVDALLQQRANRDSQRVERKRYRQWIQRWRASPQQNGTAGCVGGSAPRHDVRRALVIDDWIPRRDRDAGSLAVLSHMRSLLRLGFEVTFTPAAEFALQDLQHDDLKEIGISCACPPYYGSVEEVLRRQAGEFDVVYMHRVSNATKYSELVRSYVPKARRIYSVADLHHVRFARQSVAEDRPELLVRSQQFRFAEHVAAIWADAVITHSTVEAEALRKLVGPNKVHRVLWSTAIKPSTVSFAQRHGVAFIGDFGHEPNLDAVRWLISEIMPLVRKTNPKIECLLVGSNMPEHLRKLCGDGVIALGHVKSLVEIFDRVRLTVAPLTYGAGIKGKVIESLAAEVPCICTPIAAEGLELPRDLSACLAENAEKFAAAICTLHDNESTNAECGVIGARYVRGAFSEAALDEAMRLVLGPALLPPIGEVVARL